MKASLSLTPFEIDPARSVAELAHSLPGAARAFEELGIDYCCRGSQSLREAAAQSAVPLDHVGELCTYIVQYHHSFAREALQRLTPLTDKVLRVHGVGHPELWRVRQLLDLIAGELEPHMRKEEEVLFPYIRALAAGELPSAPFGRIEHPLRVMQLEHEHLGTLLRELDGLTYGYCPPAGACASYAVLYAGLEDLQADLHEHVHLENNVLFPAALSLKQQLERR